MSSHESVIDVIQSGNPIRLRAMAVKLANEGRVKQATQLTELAERAQARVTRTECVTDFDAALGEGM